jgi:uncharacterized membrane-anchored protein YitT (DUF2179 family)
MVESLLKKALKQVTPVNLRDTAVNYFLLTVGAVGLAINFNIFIAPANVAPGGMTGLTVIINHLTGWPSGLILLVLSIPMLILGFWQLGRFRFLVRTLYVTLINTTMIEVTAAWLPAAGITDNVLLNALYGGILGGLANGLVFRGRGSVAGTGIISRIIQLKTGIPASQIYMIIDGGVILALGLTFGWENALYALIMLFVWGLALDYVLEGPSVIRTVFIVTGKPEAISELLISRLGVGVTRWAGEGMYTHQERSVLFCTIGRPDVGLVQSLVTEIDPAAFVVIGQGHQARGGVLRRAGVYE